jgi:histone H3/H4
MSSTAPPNLPSRAPAPAPAPGAAPKAKKKMTAKKATGAGTKAKVKRPTVRTKKPAVPKKTAAANNEAIFADAATAQFDLAKQRSLSAARRSDPLWYRIEDVLPAHEITPMTSGILPEQVQVVERALSHVGLSRADVTPQAMACLLEQARRITQELMMSAQDYAYAAGRPEIATADLQLAQEMRADQHHSVASQLPKLNLLAQQVNRAPLPPIPSQCFTGVLLPPKYPHQLTSRTFDVVSAAVVAQKMVQTVPASPAALKKKQQQQQAMPYGASRGRQIPIQLKPTTTTTAVVVPMDTSVSPPPMASTRPQQPPVNLTTVPGPHMMITATANPLSAPPPTTQQPPPS